MDWAVAFIGAAFIFVSIRWMHKDAFNDGYHEGWFDGIKYCQDRKEVEDDTQCP